MNFDSLRNKFEKLREDWAEDSAVDFQFKNKQYTTDLGQLALDIPFQHNKYLNHYTDCLLYTSPSPRDRTRSRMPSSA